MHGITDGGWYLYTSSMGITDGGSMGITDGGWSIYTLSMGIADGGWYIYILYLWV